MKSKTIIIVLSVLLLISLVCNMVLVYRVLTSYEQEIIYVPYMPDSEDDFDISDPDDDIDMPGSDASNAETAPDFSVQLLTGETFTLSEHRGTVVVLSFWASWCGPCVINMPVMQAISEQFEGLAVIVGMNVAEEPGRVRDFIAERGITYKIGLDESGDIHRNLYPSAGIPYIVIIDGDGEITETFLGGRENMFEVLEEAILDAMD